MRMESLTAEKFNWAWETECTSCRCHRSFSAAEAGRCSCGGTYKILRKETWEEKTARFEAEWKEDCERREREKAEEKIRRDASWRFEKINVRMPILGQCNWCKRGFVKRMDPQGEYDSFFYCSGPCDWASINHDEYLSNLPRPKPRCRKCGEYGDCCCYGDPYDYYHE
jgi:hypothetical protein